MFLFSDKKEKQTKVIENLQEVYDTVEGMNDDCVGDFPSIQVICQFKVTPFSTDSFSSLVLGNSLAYFLKIKLVS